MRNSFRPSLPEFIHAEDAWQFVRALPPSPAGERCRGTTLHLCNPLLIRPRFAWAVRWQAIKQLCNEVGTLVISK